ncbi:MAG: hypothetical protein ACT4PM_01760 [Gemmatimonadales bacterium]
MDAPQSSPLRSALPASLALLAALAGYLVAQSAVPVGESTLFYKEPGGVRLGALATGARVVPGQRSGGFLEIALTGWIFTASTQADRREGFDLSVVPVGGENLRATPDGAIIGRAVQGALFERITRQGGWTRVRRRVWIPEGAVRSRTAGRPDGRTAGDPALGSRRSAAGDSVPDRPTGPTAQPPGRPAASDRRAILRTGAGIAQTPDGPPAATITRPMEAGLGEQKGEWVEVRFTGWVRRSEVDSLVTARPSITPAMVREQPERYVGQTVDWRVQFLALQQADELRPEMPLGQPYLLARGPLPESGFVYIMVSPEQVDRFRGLNPLDELVITATVRAGRTRYLATPVVALVRSQP